MNLTYAWCYSIFLGGERLNKFLCPERGAYWKGGFLERGSKKENLRCSEEEQDIKGNMGWIGINFFLQFYCIS